MAKTTRYEDDLLLGAVVKYAEVEKGMIKATELAEWARNNIPGLEGVEDRHFMRSVQKKNPKTGKLDIKKKKCRERIDEINNMRMIGYKVKENPILHAVDIDVFFGLPKSMQVEYIIEIRDYFKELREKNIFLQKENDGYHFENANLKKQLKILEKDVECICEEQEKIDKKLSRYIKRADEIERKNMLSDMGISDGEIDLIKYNQSLNENIDQMFNINKALISHLKENETSNDNWADKHLKNLNF